MLCQRGYLALEENMLQGSAFKKLALKPNVGDGAEKETDVGITQVDAKLLRGSCQNNVTVSVMTLGQYRHRWITAVMVHSTRLVPTWQGAHIKECKGTDGHSKWLRGQFSHLFAEHIRELFKTMHNRVALDDARLLEKKPASGDQK